MRAAPHCSRQCEDFARAWKLTTDSSPECLELAAKNRQEVEALQPTAPAPAPSGFTAALFAGQLANQRMSSAGIKVQRQLVELDKEESVLGEKRKELCAELRKHVESVELLTKKQRVSEGSSSKPACAESALYWSGTLGGPLRSSSDSRPCGTDAEGKRSRISRVRSRCLEGIVTAQWGMSGAGSSAQCRNGQMGQRSAP